MNYQITKSISDEASCRIILEMDGGARATMTMKEACDVVDTFQANPDDECDDHPPWNPDEDGSGFMGADGWVLNYVRTMTGGAKFWLHNKQQSAEFRLSPNELQRLVNEIDRTRTAVQNSLVDQVVMGRS